MCGIVGVLDHRSRDLKSVIEPMVQSLHHRGPDASGIWLDQQCGLALGHARLSILDLSPNGHQPMLSEDGRYVVTYNGEIYNFAELRHDLEQTGYRFRGHSDTEVLLAAISQWGVEPAVSRCNGMFAFALWDRITRTLYLGRDRLGEKPLYYGRSGKTFFFASELKALKAYPSFKADISRNVVALFMRHMYISSPYSIYQGIFKLPPGTILTLDFRDTERTARPVPYWTVKDIAERGAAQETKLSEEEAIDHLDQLLRDAVRLRMVADVPLGACLSGGIDSSTVVALMQTQSTRPIKTFSIGFNERSYDEAIHAKMVARHLGTEHTELYVSPEQAMAVIPLLPTMYDEPFADSSQIPTFLVSQLARRHVTVSLSGDGGDELFGGYNRYLYARSIWEGIGWMPTGFRRFLANGINLTVPLIGDAVLRCMGAVIPTQQNTVDKLQKLARILKMADQDSIYRSLLSHWKEPSTVVSGGIEPMTLLTDRTQWANLSDFTKRMMYLDTITYLPDDVLVKLDRASMAVSLEARLPLLDHRIVEFAWQVPISMKIRRSQGKWLLRQVLQRYVPHQLFDRPKMGFGIPMDSWLRGPLRDWAEDLLDERRLDKEGVFHAKPIREKWAEHLSGKRDWSYLLWDVLMFQGWWSAHGRE
jgi:asparagine synthase (glutamine-hydrolysing)